MMDCVGRSPLTVAGAELGPMKMHDHIARGRASDGSLKIGGEVEPLATIGRLTEVLAGPLGNLVSQDLRVRPRQARSVDSVERLLRAAVDLTMHRQVRGVSVERIAKEAGVTPQAAYRYFKDVEDVIRTTHRCIVVREYVSLVEKLSQSTFADEAEFARAVIDAVLQTCERIWRIPGPNRESVLWQYRQLGYDASMVISELLCRDVAPRDVRRSSEESKVAACLTATIAVATSFVSRKIFPLRDGKLETMLTRLFVGLLRNCDDEADSFCEPGPDIDELRLLWCGQALSD